MLTSLPLPPSPCAPRKYCFTFCTPLAKSQYQMNPTLHLPHLCLGLLSAEKKKYNEWSPRPFTCSLSADTGQASFSTEVLALRQELPEVPACQSTHLTVIASSAPSFLLLQKQKCPFLWNPSTGFWSPPSHTFPSSTSSSPLPPSH